MVTKRDLIYGAIDLERKYQDQKFGNVGTISRSLCDYIVILESELDEVKEAYVRGDGSIPKNALEEMIQVVAVGVRCLEECGIYVNRKRYANQKH